MADADASASFELEDDSLSAGLDSLAARFEQVAAHITASFSGANAQLAGTTSAITAVGASAALIQPLGAGLALAARAATAVASGVSGIVSTVTLLAPFTSLIPDSFGKWAPPLKRAAEQLSRINAGAGVATRGFQALQGRLGLAGTGMLGLHLHTLGATKGMSALGAVGALSLSKIIAGVQVATRAIRGLGSLPVRVGAGLGGVGRSLGGALTALAPTAGLAAALGPVGGSVLAVAGSLGVLKKSMSSAAEVQSMQASFVTLLGSMDAARGRMAELSSFAASTPFEIPQVVEASKVLQSLTTGALATGAGLRLVGDVAANTGEPFEQVAVHVGRLYQGLMDGRPVGEAMARLQELGALLPQTRTRLEEMQKAGAKGGGVWTVAARDLMRYSGEMERQSATWGGVMSNFADSVGNVFRAIGAPLVAALTPFMQHVNTWLGTIIPLAQRFGQIVGTWSGVAAQIFADGKLGSALQAVGTVAFGQAANFLAGSLVGIAHGFGSILQSTFENALRLFSVITTADFWSGLAIALKSAFMAAVTLLTEGLAQAFDTMRKLPGVGKGFGKASDSLHSLAGSMGEATMDEGARAVDKLTPALEAFRANTENTLKSFATAFERGRASVGDLFDTSEASATLKELLSDAFAGAKRDQDRVIAVLSRGGLPAPAPTPTNPPEKEPAGKAKVIDAPGVSELRRIGLGGYAGGGSVSMLPEKSKEKQPFKTPGGLAAPFGNGGSDPLVGIARAQLSVQGVMVSRLEAIEKALGQKRSEPLVPRFT